MKQKYFWNKKWFWISLTSLTTVGLATFSTVTNSAQAITANNLTKSMFADSATSVPDVKTLSGYGYHGISSATYVPWSDNNSRKIIDVFPTVGIANQVLSALRTSSPMKFGSGTISSPVLKTDLADIQTLNLSNLDLNNIDEVLNPAITWTKLTTISLSNNNFGDYVLKFEQSKMPKLYSVTARNANLQEMVDVSSYVLDPFDQAAASSTERNNAEKQYDKAATSGVPRYFDLFQNNIQQIPKYYLKIALAYLNLGSNKLGTGTPADPQGVYAIPWYSMKTTTNTNTIGIADPDSRGPYGINLYSTGETKTDGEYVYSDEVVARWRAQPFPMKGLRFANYNLTAGASGSLDSGITFPATDASPATGGVSPYFNFANNSLVNIPIFSQANVTYNPISSIAPQGKVATVFVGLNDFKESKRYTEASTKPEMVTPQPDMIYPITSNWSWNSAPQDNLTWFAQGMQGLYYPRSFNGINQFTITSDSRNLTGGNVQWDNATTGRTGITAKTGGGVDWVIPALPTTNWNSIFSSNQAFFGRASGNLNFSNTSDNNYYQKWTALRTFPLSSKTFAKKSYTEAWTGKNDIDSNLYYDNAAWTGALSSDTLSPKGISGATWFFQTLVGHDTSPNYRVPTGGATQFAGAPATSVNRSYILGLAQAAYFSNIGAPSDYGTPQATSTPFTQGLTISAPQYNYNANYQVVDSIKSDFENKANFPSTLDATGFSLSQYKVDNKPVFARNISANDIKNGRGIFWKSTSQFDQAYMNSLDPDKIKMEWDDAAGTLKYSFPVYSPGYSTLGRLFKNGDTNATATNNATPTIDFEVTNTISGFATTSFKMKEATGNNFADVKPEAATNHVLSQKAPEDFLTWVQNNPITSTNDTATISAVKAELVKNFQTNYLGNNATDPEGALSNLNVNYVDIVSVDNSNGVVGFRINIPDYVFSNGNRLVFPQTYKDLTFNWTGLPVATLAIVGNNLSQTMAPGLSFSTFDINAYAQLKAKAASEVTAADIVNANVITSSRADWTAIKGEPSNFNNYFDLSPTNVTGTLTWTLKLPGDANTWNNGLLPLTVVVQWTGFMHQSTTITWKPNTTLQPFGLGKTPDQLLDDIQANPSKYLNITNGRQSGSDPFTPQDFDFTKMKSVSVINVEQGRVQVQGIALKSYYLNGAWIDNSGTPAPSVSPVYLPVPSIILQAQIPYSVATFKSETVTGATSAAGNSAIWASVTPFYQKSIYDDTTEDNATLVKKLSTSEIKQLLVNNNISPLDNVLSLSTSPATSLPVPRNNLQYQNSQLKQSIFADPLNGTLTFQNLTVNNWLENGSNTPVNNHALDAKTYTFTKLNNTWKWANSLPFEVSSLPFNTLLSELNNPVTVNALMDHFNVGQKYYDNDGVLKNSYTVNTSLITLDPYLGTLTFKAGAIQVKNWVTNGVVATAPHPVTEEKVYNLTNKLETQYQGNTNLTQGVNQYISEWVRVVKNDSYVNATPEKQAEYLSEFNQLHAPSYRNVDVDRGIVLTQQYLGKNNLNKLTEGDKNLINNLKSSGTYSAVDFSDYFYVPQFLLFLSSPTTSRTANNRTFAIAKSVEKTTFSNTAMQLSDIYVINYYNFPGANTKSIQKIPNILFTNFLRAVSSVTFNPDTEDASTNLLATEWANLSATQIKAQLDYLTANRNNPTIRAGAYWQSIQKQWLSTFSFKNIPYNGIRDLTIVYPANIVASDYQRKLVVNELLFPYYSQTTTATNPDAIVLNQTVANQQVWLAKVGADSFIQQTADLKDDKFQKIPSTLLQNLGLAAGTQTNGTGTWAKLVEEGVFVLNGNLAPISESLTIGTAPAVSVGEIVVSDQSGTITFKNVVGSNVWVDGKQVGSKNFADLVLNLGLQSTHLVKNSNNLIEQWLVSTTNETSIANGLINFYQKLINKEFSLAEFNAMLNNANAFFNVASPANDTDIKVQVAPNMQPIDAFHLNLTNGQITFKNLQIIKGYLNNVKVETQDVTETLVFNLGWDYSTSFSQQFQALLSQKQLLNSNTDHAAAVLNQDKQQLLRYLNVQELEGQLETPSVSVSSNPVLGKLTFNVKFQNYYQNGVNLGVREFNYTFTEFQQTLPAILGGIGAGLAVILIALLAWYIRNYIKNKDQLMIKTANKKKQE